MLCQTVPKSPHATTRAKTPRCAGFTSDYGSTRYHSLSHPVSLSESRGGNSRAHHQTSSNERGFRSSCTHHSSAAHDTHSLISIVRRFSRPSSHRPPNSMYTMLKGCGLFPHLYPLTYLIAVTSAVYIRSTHYSTLPAVLHIPLVGMNQPSELL